MVKRKGGTMKSKLRKRGRKGGTVNKKKDSGRKKQRKVGMMGEK